MSIVIFNYKFSKVTIQCNGQELMKDIYKSFESKIKIDKEIDISKLIFMYNGSPIDENLTFNQVIKGEDKKSNQMIILVQDLEKGEAQNEKIIKSYENVCPTCEENAFIKISDYKININDCPKAHNTFNILLNEYEKTQGIDASQIICENDDCKSNMVETYANAFYRCITCKKNLCPLCKSKHSKNNKDDKIIDYNEKNYICETHKSFFTKYCKDCKLNLCLFCGKEHKEHIVIDFQDIILTKEDHLEEIAILKDNLDKLNNEIDDIMEKLKTVKDNFQIYYKIYNDIINNYKCLNTNYEFLCNIAEFKNYNNNIRNDIDAIIKDDNISNKFNGILKIYEKMTNKENIIKFEKDPHDLKYKLDITNTNDSRGASDIFEVFTSYKDKKGYIASKNINYCIDIFALLDNQKIKSLSGHNNSICTIRYFINNKDYNEYLISADHNYLVILWDITNNYNIKYKIETEYDDIIYSCLLVFPDNNDDNFILTSTISTSDEDEQSPVKVYSLNNGEFVKNIDNNEIYYLLSWYDKNNNKYYIVQLSNKKIIINNLLEDELYCELIHQPEGYHNSGFIFSKDNNDYLCSSSTNGYIHIWDLYNKNIFKAINTNNCYLMHIIQWNSKYIIVADFDKKCFKIINLENDNIADIEQKHTKEVVCIKKVYDDKYGESLLSAGNDNTIKLWNI